MISIFPLPARQDNYIWLLKQERDVVVVDPSDADPVLAFLAKNGLTMTACLLTHDHHDHTDGVPALADAFPDAPIYGPEEVQAFATQLVVPEQHFRLWTYDVRVIESAGHTAQHVSYLVDNQWLFCGDALFSGGCGRVFTGDYQAQFDTLQRFLALPDWVEIYAGHEYTQSNLQFAEAVMGSSCVLAEYQERAAILRAQHQPTLPTTLGVEKQINPFLRAKSVAEFQRLRQEKDHF